MKKTIYSKINKRRNPDFQTLTKIVDDGEKLSVVKTACNTSAERHIKNIYSYYEKNCELYRVITPLKCDFYDNSLVFPYITGKNATSIINLKKSEINELCTEINYFFDNVIVYNESVYCDFNETDEFKKIFGNSEGYKGRALKYVDIDMIFDNLIECDGKWYSYDYEWTFLFPIPIEFMRFRVLYRYYCSELDYFSDKYTLYEFLDMFGISKDRAELFERWEYTFLNYVYGKDFKYDYINNYQKNAIDFEKLVNEYGNLEKAFNDRNESIWTYEKVKKDLDDEILKNHNTIQDKQNEIENQRNEINQHKKEIKDKQKKIEKQQAELNRQQEEIKKLKNEIEVLKDQYNTFKNNSDIELKKILREYQNVCAKYDDVVGSKIWTMSKPIRTMLDGK